MDFSSFLIQKTNFYNEIKNIILFGSVARGEESKDSDIDIFIDILKENDKIESDMQKWLDEFLKSTKYNNYWKMLDVKNEIKLTIGNFDKWKNIQPAIISNGIILYGKFKHEIKEAKHKTLFVWENIKPNSKRVLFNKQLFGYKQNKKFYNGLIQKYNGERLGKGCIIIDLENANILQKFFKENRITVKIKKFAEYS